MKRKLPLISVPWLSGLRARAALVLIAMLCYATGAWAQKAIPYEYGFENHDLAAEGWTTQNPSELDDSKFLISTNAKMTGDYGFQFSSYNDQGDHTQYLISPELNAPNGVSVQFYYMASSTNGTEHFKVGYSTTDTEISSFSFGSEIITNSTSWTQSEEFIFPAGTKYVAIYYFSNWQYYLYVDDFTFVIPPACMTPTNLAVTTDGQTATVTWDGTAANGYIVTVNNGTPTNFQNNSYTFDVDLSTTYEVEVMSNCGDDGNSDPATISFTTPSCLGGHAIEYVLNDSYGDGWNGNAINIIDACGNVETLTIGNGSTNSGTLNLCGDYYEFVWKTGNYAGETSFTLIDNGVTIYDNQGGSSLSNGQVLYTIGTNNMLPRPTDLATGTPEVRQVELSWTENGTATAWEICINGDEGNLIPANSNPFTLDQLTPGTEYSVKVRATDGTHVSCWSDAVTFTTVELCPAPTNVTVSNITANSADIAWTGNDDATSYNLRYAISVGGFFEGFENGLDQWTVVRNSGGTDYTDWHIVDPANVFSNTTFPAHSGDYVVMSRSYSGSAYNVDNWLISPQVDLGNTMTFWMMGDPVYPEHYEIWVSTTTTDLTAFTKVFESDDATDDWSEVTVDLSAYDGQTGYVAFRNNCYDADFIFIDDVTITAPSSTLDWTTVNTVNSSYTITELTPDTKYNVQVQAVYQGGSSKWTAASFTTPEKVPTPTDLAASEVEARTAALSWTENGEATAWEICLNDDEENLIAADSNPFTLTGLTPATAYTAKVRAIGEDNEKSKWSKATSFTTGIANPAPTAVAANNITATAADISWTAKDYATGAELQYAKYIADGSVRQWLQYDDGEWKSLYGNSSTHTVTWGVMYPAEQITGNLLTKVSMYEYEGYNTGDITINIYQGGDNAPSTLLYTEVVTPLGTSGFHEVTLASAVDITPGENLWITLTETGTFVLNVCNSDDPNNKWIYGDGAWVTWAVDGYGWMIRAEINSFDPEAMEWTTVSNASSPCQLTGLTPETIYVARVKSLFEENLESAWSSTIFTTNELLVLPDDDDNSLVIEAYDNKFLDVTLGRTIQTGYWNTFSAPFAIDAATVTAKGMTVKKLDTATLEGETLTLNFATVESIEAGKPYLVKVAETLANPTFEGVTVINEVNPTEIPGILSFIPTVLGQTVVYGDKEYILFLAANNKLKHPSTLPAGMMGFRAYFQLDDNSAAHEFHLNLGDGDGEATGIISMEANGADSEAIYTLDGRRVNQPTQKGVYIKNGKKIVLK